LYLRLSRLRIQNCLVMTTLPHIKLTQEDLDRVFSIMQSLQKFQPDIPIVLDSFEQYGMTDRILVRACLSELHKRGKIMEWPLLAPLPERKQS
jgi:hypothetical protein